MSAHTMLDALKRADYTQAPDRGGSTPSAAIYPDRQFSVVRLSSAGAETRTVSAPRKSGLIFTLDMIVDGGDITVTVTGGYDEAGSTTLTFSAIGQFATLISMEEAAGTYVWRLLAYDGVTGPSLALGSLSLAGDLTVAGVTEPTGGVASAGGLTSSARLCHTGGVPAILTTSGTNSATNTAGTVYLAEIFVPNNKSVTGVAIWNGTAVAGNGKMALYDSAGTRVAISDSTAMSGTTAYQLIPFTGGPLAVSGPATYFIGAIYDDTSHDLRGHAVGSFATGTDAGNTYATDSTFATVTVPTTFTADIGPIASLY